MVKLNKSSKVDIGINGENRKKTAEALSHFLADTYTLYLRTHYFHWNVTGPLFVQLHSLFESHYTELAVAVDNIAERIRALGIFAPGSYAEFEKLNSLKFNHAPGVVPKADEMILESLHSHEAISKTAQTAFEIANEAGDEVTADMLIQRMQVHEKAAWMLRSFQEQ